MWMMKWTFSGEQDEEMEGEEEEEEERKKFSYVENVDVVLVLPLRRVEIIATLES